MKTYKVLSIVSCLMLNCATGLAANSKSILETVKTFTGTQPSVSELLDELAATSFVIREGSDAELRPLFVNAQVDFERALVQLLRSKEIVKSICIIHAPAPATPLCTNGEISKGFADPSIRNDPERSLTVKDRPGILREYLSEGGYIFTAHPKGGRALRSPEQLKVLDDLLRNHSSLLQEIELTCTHIPEDLIGATYILTFADSGTYVLSIKSSQANSLKDGRRGIWFGSIHEPIVSERLQAVMTFFNKHLKPE